RNGGCRRRRSLILFLIYLYFSPHFFDKRLLTTLAFWEWVLCVDCAASLWLLTAALEAIAPRCATLGSQLVRNCQIVMIECLTDQSLYFMTVAA
nr:hypothetical protein [Acidobacteriota bacterium]